MNLANQSLTYNKLDNEQYELHNYLLDHRRRNAINTG